MRHVVRILSFLAISFVMAGCLFVPIISGFRDMGATADARQEMLKKAVKAFHDAVRSSNMTVAMSFIDKEKNPELREAIRNEMRRLRDKEKVVDSKLDFVEYDDDSYTADVEVRSKFFVVPYYVVNEKLETEKWEFETIGSKWILVSRKSELMQDGEVIK